MKLHPSVRGTCALVALALAATTGGTALAADAAAEATTFHPPLTVTWDLPIGGPAFQAAIDAETGLLTAPSAAQRIELTSLLAPAVGLRRAVASVVVLHSDGSSSAMVDPDLYSASTVVIDDQGGMHFSCGDATHTTHVHPVTVTAPAAEER